jgi:hypothetical protein
MEDSQSQVLHRHLVSNHLPSSCHHPRPYRHTWRKVTQSHQEGRVLQAGLVPAAPVRHWEDTGCHLLRVHGVRTILWLSNQYIPGPGSARGPNS